jgi:hypothetical protein
MSILVERAFWDNLSTYLYYYAARRLFKTETYHSVLLTSQGPSGKTIETAAFEENIDIYGILHSIRTEPSIDHSRWDGIFTEGRIVEKIVDCNNTKCIPTGLPKLVSLYNTRKSIPKNHEDKTLLVGTMYVPVLREEFIRDIIPPVLNQTDWQIIIKIHPKEDSSFYTKLLSKLDINKDNNRIKVVEENLNFWIGRSHLLITTFSNIGIESVVLGTPAVSYNPWSPKIRDPPYAKYGSVPCFQQPSEVVSMIDNFNQNEEIARQEQMLGDLYRVYNNSIRQIADKIQEEIT